MVIDQVAARWKVKRLPETVRRPVINHCEYFKWRTVGCAESHDVLLPNAVRTLRGITVQLDAEADVSFDVLRNLNGY